jgi:hypothetical protein
MSASKKIAKHPYCAQTGWCWSIRFSERHFLTNTTPAFGLPSSAEEQGMSILFSAFQTDRW